MVKISCEGDLRNKISYKNQEIFTDAPGDLGRGEYICPADLLGAAYASCAMTIMAMEVQNLGENFTGCYVNVKNDVDMEHFMVAKISLKFHLKADFSPDAKKVAERAFNEPCIVGRSISESVARDAKFIYE